MTDVTPATMDDLERLVALWQDLAAGQRDHGSTVVPEGSVETVRESLAQHVLSDGVRVARDDEIVGFVMFGPDDTGFERDRRRGVVRNVYVVPGARGEGVGTALLDAAEAELAAAGVDVVVLEAMADNERARSFYRERGYDVHRVTMVKSVESDTHTR